jgi:hypothetical protein
MQGADTQAQTQPDLPLQLLQRVVQFSLASQKLHCLLKHQHDASGASAGRGILHFVSFPQVLLAVSTPRILHAVGMQSAACSQHATNPANPACIWQTPTMPCTRHAVSTLVIPGRSQPPQTPHAVTTSHILHAQLGCSQHTVIAVCAVSTPQTLHTSRTHHILQALSMQTAHCDACVQSCTPHTLHPTCTPHAVSTL